MFKKFLGFLLLTLVQIYDSLAVAPNIMTFTSQLVADSMACFSWCSINGRGAGFIISAAIYGVGQSKACACYLGPQSSYCYCDGTCYDTTTRLYGSGLWTTAYSGQNATLNDAYGTAHIGFIDIFCMGCTSASCGSITGFNMSIPDKNAGGIPLAVIGMYYGCSDGVCTSDAAKYQIACYQNYYGSLNRSVMVSTYYSAYSSYCTPCPSGGQTVAEATTSITGCFLPTGTTSSDTTGTYTATASCYYVN